MEPSQDLAPAEEFNGSESGWTTYIGSPIYNDDDEQSVDFKEYGWNNYKDNHHGDINDDIDDDGDKVESKDDDSNNNKVTYDDNEESDDSMVSDASSGPSHLLSTNRVDNTGHGHEKILSAKRTSKKVRNRRNKRMIEKEEDDEEEHSLLVTDSAASHV